MMNKEITLGKLFAFKKLDKFSPLAWEKRGLNTSKNEVCNTLQNLFDSCAASLIEAIDLDLRQNDLKSILEIWLANINRIEFDTEEKEFICDYFNQLSKIVSVDFKDKLNDWLYGTAISQLFKETSFSKRNEKIAGILSQECTGCGLKLETFVIRKEKGIPDHSWAIIQCNNCDENNLLSVGLNIKQYRFGNYRSIELLLKTEYNEEQAIVRLEQINSSRKN
jgi:hypothetical protein